MQILSQVEQLYAAKPQPFGPRQSPSSIIKQAFNELNIRLDGALEDEQGNKRMHGGPFMALHQYSQESYSHLREAFPNTPRPFELGSIGENISAPHMNESNVFIGDQYKIGKVILKVVSPRAPCSKINHRYGEKNIDLFVGKTAITGWYYSVVQEGELKINEDIKLHFREHSPISVKQIWQLRQLQIPTQDNRPWLALSKQACQEPSLAPEWQDYMQRVASRLDGSHK